MLAQSDGNITHSYSSKAEIVALDNRNHHVTSRRHRAPQHAGADLCRLPASVPSRPIVTRHALDMVLNIVGIAYYAGFWLHGEGSRRVYHIAQATRLVVLWSLLYRLNPTIAGEKRGLAREGIYSAPEPRKRHGGGFFGAIVSSTAQGSLLYCGLCSFIGNINTLYWLYFVVFGSRTSSTSTHPCS